MVNQNEKWWHIQLFLFVLMLNHFFFFCLIEISTIWRYCEYCEVETGIPKVAVAFAFSTTQKTIAAGTPSQMKRKQKGFFFVVKFPVCFNPKKNCDVQQLSFCCVKEAEGGITAKQNWPHKSWLCQKCLDCRQKSSFGNWAHFFYPFFFFVRCCFKLHKWAPALVVVKTRQKIRELCIVIFRVGSPVITKFSALEFWTFPHKSWTDVHRSSLISRCIFIYVFTEYYV